MGTWLGVDVGGERKRFDVAVIDEVRLLELERRVDVDGVLALIDAHTPSVVAIDSPCSCAPHGSVARQDELALNRAVCGIRWTPDETEIHANPYYAWVVEGLTLYRTLEDRRDLEVIEVFPTASWTRWSGKRNATRATWTRKGLRTLGLKDLPLRTGQDQRDAIAAAVTARQHAYGLTERFGEIVVPLKLSGPGRYGG